MRAATISWANLSDHEYFGTAVLDTLLSCKVRSDRSPVVLGSPTFQTIRNEKFDIGWFVNIIAGNRQWFTRIDRGNQMRSDEDNQFLFTTTGAVGTASGPNDGQVSPERDAIGT